MGNLAKTTVTGSLQISNLQDLNSLGELLSRSGYFSDAQGAAQCAVKVLAGMEMGFGAFSSMTGIHIMPGGKPEVGAHLLASAVKEHPKYDYRVRQIGNTVCRLEFFENGQSIGESSFSMEDAEQVRVWSKKQQSWVSLLESNPNYRSYPRNMLFARAMSNGVSWFCPDVTSTRAYTESDFNPYDSALPAEPITLPQNDVWQKFQQAIARAETEEQIVHYEALIHQRIQEGVVPNPGAAHDAVAQEVAIARERIQHRGYSQLPKYLDAIAQLQDPLDADTLRHEALADLTDEELTQFNQALDARMSELNQQVDMELAES